MSTKENNALDQLKDIEQKKQKAVLIKALKFLKQKAKEVLAAKYATNEILKQLNISKDDQKAIIDWVNQLQDVKLSDDDETVIEDEVKDFIADKKKKVESELETIKDCIGSYYSTNSVNTVNTPYHVTMK